MDPELLNLFLAASKAQGGNSKVLSALNNPWISFLSGAYSPPVDGGASGGSLWATYANNPDYPELQPIIQAIQGGADEYQTQEAVNRALGSSTTLGFFSDSNLRKLASDLQKEYSGGGSTGSGGSRSKQDVWSKAGLRNPTDVYTAGDVPLPSSVQLAMMKLMPGYDSISKIAGSKKAAYDSAVRQWKSAKDEVEAGAGKPKGVPATAYAWAPDGSGETFAVDYFPSEQEKADSLSKKDAAYNKAFQASSESAIFQMEKEKRANAIEAYQRGVLRAYQEAGRTPAKDQMSTILKFIASSK
jgi:hypothetical protein